MDPHFNTPETTQRMLVAASSLMTAPQNSMRYRLGQTLRIIAKNAEIFDLRCQANIEWMGSRLINRVSEIKADSADNEIETLVYMTYRLVREFHMSMKDDLSPELSGFLNIVDDSVGQMSAEAQQQISFARQYMPIGIVKSLINSERYGPLSSIASIAADANKRIDDWKSDLEKSKQHVKELADTLARQEQAFNFVGLHKGFSDLADSIIKELKFARWGLAIFGSLMLVPSIVDLWLVMTGKIDLSKLGSYTLAAVLLSTISITLLFLYFFRITLRKADSCRAQLVQIRLRMSLCRFIQSYADYSADIKSKNSDALSKFEALIFSGIVGTEDKLPSTFDGIEQLSALAKALRGQG